MNVISDKIYIDFYNSKLNQEFLSTLVYDNPDYFMKMNIGISVYGVPKQFQTFELKNGVLTVTRGEYGKLIKADPNIEVKFDFEDHPIDLQYINNDFQLDDFQEGCVETLKTRRQGVVHAVTSAGKSLMIVKAICELKQRAVIIVHRKLLMEQFINDIKAYVRDKDGKPIKIGFIGNGKYEIGDITIAIDKTLAKNLYRCRKEFGVVFMDECHLAPSATMYTVINSLCAERRYGFSGTLKRKDQKEFLMYASFGPIIYSITRSELENVNRVVKVEPKIITSNVLFDFGSVIESVGVTRAHQMLEDFLMKSTERKKIILDEVVKMKGKTIILSKRVEPCYELQHELLEKYGVESGVITGKDAKGSLESFNKMKFDDLQIIFATVGCVSTGISISDLQNIFLISPIYSNEALLKQIRGRVMRTAPGKDIGYLYFLYDQHVFHPGKLQKFLSIIKD